MGLGSRRLAVVGEEEAFAGGELADDVGDEDLAGLGAAEEAGG